MEPPKIERNIRTLENNRPYFGNYLNMARHNAYIILKDIGDTTEELNILELEEDSLHQSGIIPALNNSKKADIKLKGVNRLKNHFPFLQMFDDPAEALACLRSYLENLNRLRNRFTHSLHEKSVKNNFKDFDQVFIAAVNKVPVRFREIISPENTRHMVLADEVKGKRGKTELKYSITNFYLLQDEKDELTEKGLAFFICLFLERKYAFRFLSRLYGFKNTTNPDFRATLEAFGMFCCRLPKPKLESGELMLDMLGELSRCPGEIYGLLDEGERNKLIAVKDEDSADAESDSSGDSEAEETPVTIMRRYGDRFPYFAMRFMDEAGYFNQLRFYLKLGRFVKSEYKKEITGEERIRKQVTDINVFGKLINYNAAAAPQSWKNKDSDEFNNRIDQFAPHYRIRDNRIAIRLLTDDELKKEPYWPDIWNGEFNNLPHAILSIYELQNLFFCQFLNNKNKNNIDAEDIINQYIQNYKRFIKDFRENSISKVDDKPFKKRRNIYKQEEKEELEKRNELLQEILVVRS